MPERMMVTCPGCDGVVSVSPTGDEAEVRCPKCDEMVYARNAQGGEWWANFPVADPTVEKPEAVPAAPTTPEVPVVSRPPEVPTTASRAEWMLYLSDPQMTHMPWEWRSRRLVGVVVSREDRP